MKFNGAIDVEKLSVACFDGKYYIIILGLFWVMRWQYTVSLFLVLLSLNVFFGLAAYHIESVSSYPIVGPEERRTVGYTWIWYHPDQWVFSFVFSLGGLLFFAYGVLVDVRESRSRLAGPVNAEIIEESVEEK